MTSAASSRDTNCVLAHASADGEEVAAIRARAALVVRGTAAARRSQVTDRAHVVMSKVGSGGAHVGWRMVVAIGVVVEARGRAAGT